MAKKLSTFQQLRELKPWAAQAFCLAVLARMVPHFTLFQEAQQQAPSEHDEIVDPHIADHVLSLLWSHLSDPKQKFNIGVQLEKIEAATPDYHYGDGFGALPAMDACLGLAAVLRLLQQEQLDAAVVVAKLAQGGVEAYLLMTEFASQQATLETLTDEAYDQALRDLNTALKAHPLMQFEVSYQQDLISVLASANSGKLPDRVAFVKRLQALVAETEMSTLGIELSLDMG